MEFKTIRELCDIVVDCPHSTPVWTNCGKIVIRNQYIKNGRIDLSSPSYTDDEHFAQRIKRAKPTAGDIIITREAPIGDVGMVPDGVECCLGQRMVLLRANPEICDNYYLLYSLQSRYVQHQISWSEGTGTTVSNLRIPHLEQLKIPYLPMEQQRKMAGILRSVEDKMDINRKINDNLQHQAQTLYAKHFCLRDGDSIPDGWSLVSLGDVAVISNKSFNPLKQPETMLEHYSIPAFDETRYPVFELSTAIKSNKFVVDADCFMISKLNPTTKRVWRPYCMTDNAVCSTEFIVYKAKDRMLTDFLFSLIDSVPFSDFMCSHVTGSTGSRQRTIPSDTLQYQFYLPTAEEIAAFSAVVAPMYAQIRINAMENARLKDLRDSLLPRLMSGEIEVSDVGI